MGPRIGVYVCHCGSNIAGKVRTDEVIEYIKSIPEVVVAKDYKFMCSDPGQELIQGDIKAFDLERVVVASCSPLMHEPTFRRACENAGLNRYLLQMTNIREQCSWVTEDDKAATKKAMALVRGAVHRAMHLEPLETKEVDIHPDTLVVGAGIAGIQAALDLADAGKKVYLVEKEPSIGGHMSQFDKTFPTLDCAACILTPKMVSVGKHENIELMTYSEVKEISGYIGNFKVKIAQKPRFVDVEKCNGCGLCWENCPSVTFPRRRRIRIGEKLIKELK